MSHERWDAESGQNVAKLWASVIDYFRDRVSCLGNGRKYIQFIYLNAGNLVLLPAIEPPFVAEKYAAGWQQMLLGWSILNVCITPSVQVLLELHLL